MLESLKNLVYQANIELVKKKLVIYTWGNVSAIDREKGLVVIKPSGVDYRNMTADDMVVVDLKSGAVVEGNYRPSSDTPTHLELYRNFLNIGGITHTHSLNATAFAQAGLSIPALGTTHADYFYGDIPCTRALSKAEVDCDYELNTGKVIVETFAALKVCPERVPSVLVKNHGPFSWGTNATDSVHNAVVLDAVAEMTMKSLILNPKSTMDTYILDKHYNRKHGADAYYGQDLVSENRKY